MNAAKMNPRETCSRNGIGPAEVSRKLRWKGANMAKDEHRLTEQAQRRAMAVQAWIEWKP